ncbi:MAG: peptide chain release factor N(5)-glutamine methyltransferase [Saprospiraceae bacterium]
MNIKEVLSEKLEVHFDKALAAQYYRILIDDICDLETMQLSDINKIVNQLLAGTPIQYITGKAPFYGYFFKVDSNVLIPRAETEELVYTIEKHLKEKKITTPSILDIGTGSGCIPITLNLLFKDANITALDISKEAIIVAESNNIKLGANVKFITQDILVKNIALPKYDIIVSNPPYIPYNEQSLMSKNVLDHEPHIALFVADENALIFYKAIFEFSNMHLNNNGAIFLECNEYNAQNVRSIFAEKYNCTIIRDMQQKQRILKAVTKN